MRKKVIAIEKRALSVTGEGLIFEIFYYIRISDGARDTWVILHESDFNAIRREIENGKN